MNLETIKTFATSRFARQVLVAQKHSPKALFAVGVVGVVGATVLACRATLKVTDVLEEHDRKAEKLKALGKNPVVSENLDDELSSKNAKLKLHTLFEITKLYAPAVGVGIIGISALTGSHVILTKRNTAVMAAYAGIQKACDEYRSRVRSEYGDDIDAKFSGGFTERIVEEKTSDGKPKLTNAFEKTGKFGGSPYAVVFDEQSKYFSKEPGRNEMTLTMKQNWANDKLRLQGHLFLNEVYDMLGLSRTKAGAVVGWVFRKDSEKANGDNYVSFGVLEGDTEWVHAFLDGAEKYITLDFNVDGAILDLI
jgi:hypothetical protein